MTAFRYAPEIIETFPDIRGGVLVAGGVVNGASPPDLVERYRAEQQAAVAQIGDRSLADLPSLAAWRRAFRGFGVDPTKYRNAAESLLRRLVKRGEIPSLGCLVDIGNLVSIRHRLPLAVFDRSRLTGGITVRFADGTEPFVDLGTTEVVHPELGEVVFVDDDDRVMARRWCWRQGDPGATRPDTIAVLISVEAHHVPAGEVVGDALEDLAALLERHAQASSIRSALLSPAFPEFAG